MDVSLTWAVWCHSLALTLALSPHPSEVFLFGAGQILLFAGERAALWSGQEVNFPLRHPDLSAGVNDFFFFFSCGEKHLHCSEKGSFSLSVIAQVVGFLLASEIHYKSQSGKSSNTVPSLAAEFGYVAGSYSVAHP